MFYILTQVTKISQKKTKKNKINMLSYFDSRDINRGPIKKSMFYDAMKESDSYNNIVYSRVKKLIRIRKQYPVMTRGSFTEIKTESPNVFAYVREYAGDRIVVINNLSSTRTRASVVFINDNFGKKSKDIYLKDLLTDKLIKAKAQNKTLTVRLNPYGAMWLKL